MNNYDDIIEQIHQANVCKRVSESNTPDKKMQPVWSFVAIAASIACLVCVSVFFVNSYHPQTPDMADVSIPIQYQNGTTIDAVTQDSPTTPILSRTSKDEQLTVVCQNDCNIDDVLSRFKQTLLTLN